MLNPEILVMKKLLEHFDSVPFKVTTPGGDAFVIGQGEPRFQVDILKPLSKKELATSTSLALGEAYMRGDLQIKGDLLVCLDSIMKQLDNFVVDKNALKNLLFTSLKKSNQKKEVSSHYDIGNDFYKLWLDETMSYSCAYFEKPDATLYQAQLAKIDHSLRKLNLSEGMSLLDIGCGWGGLLIAAAKRYKVKGLGLTLSQEQCKEANARIQAEGLSHMVEVRVMDYRDLEKSGLKFDRIVSIGMVEHVGRDNYPLYMRCAKAALNPGGVFLLHSITGRKENPGDPWIKKYIFPGGVLPSLRELIHQAYEEGFLVSDVESLRLHYYKTLLCWYHNFQEHRQEVLSMMGEEFTRMWELYLGSCAASFHWANIDIHQILMTAGCNNDLPMTRDYLYR